MASGDRLRAVEVTATVVVTAIGMATAADTVDAGDHHHDAGAPIPGRHLGGEDGHDLGRVRANAFSKGIGTLNSEVGETFGTAIQLTSTCKCGCRRPELCCVHRPSCGWTPHELSPSKHAPTAPPSRSISSGAQLSLRSYASSRPHALPRPRRWHRAA